MLNYQKLLHSYDDLLTNKYKSSSVASVQEFIGREILSVSGRNIFNVIRPIFINRENYQSALNESLVIYRCLKKLINSIVNERLEELSFLHTEDQACLYNPLGKANDVIGIARLDGFFQDDNCSQVKFVEINTESPGGILFGHEIVNFFSGLEIMKELSREFNFHYFDSANDLVSALLNYYSRWSSSNKIPNIAIVDLDDASTKKEFDLAKYYLEKRGCKVIIVDPRLLDIHKNRLVYGDFEIDLVYRRILCSDAVKHQDDMRPFLKASLSNLACFVNPFSTEISNNKILFEFLRSEKFKSLFNFSEQAIIQKCIPWTCYLTKKITVYNGASIDLIDFVVKNKNNFVLKPNSSHGAKSVTIGWETDQGNWEQAIANAINSDFVVQERVSLREELCPYFDQQESLISFAKYNVDFNPYIWNESFASGAGIRLSQSTIINVGTGGSAGAVVLF